MDADFLSNLPAYSFIFIMVLCRVSIGVMLLPGIGDDSIPTVIKAGLALTFTIFIMPVVAGLFPSIAQQKAMGFEGMLSLMACELIVGAIIGWLAKLMSLSLPIAGQIISTMIGISSVLQPDPDLGSQTTAMSRMMSLMVPTIMFTSGIYIIPVMAIVNSYTVFPPGHLLSSGDLIKSVLIATSSSFGLAMEFSGPFILVGTVWQVMLGLLSRFVPALQVYTLSLPAQILGGLMLVALTIHQMAAAWSDGMNSSFHSLPGL